MNRREFLKGSIVTLLAIPLVGCGSDDQPAGTGGSTNNSCQGTSATGSFVGHTHTVCVLSTDLTNPPSGGGTYNTTSNSGHLHSVVLTQANLVTINGGASVTVDSSSSSGHTHSFTIQKA